MFLFLLLLYFVDFLVVFLVIIIIIIIIIIKKNPITAMEIPWCSWIPLRACILYYSYHPWQTHFSRCVSIGMYQKDVIDNHVNGQVLVSIKRGVLRWSGGSSSARF